MTSREKIKGVFATSKILSDGSKRTYWYHRSTKTALPGKHGSPEFLAAFLEAERIQPAAAETIANLIREYLLSPKFVRNKAESTKKEYKRMLAHLELEFGEMPIMALESPKARGVFFDYQERIGRSTPREADNQLSVLSAVFAYAFDKGKISRNPIVGFERLHRSNRSDIIWTEGDVTRFMKDAPAELQRVMILALHTGQRYGDLIRLRWSDFDVDHLLLTQSKTGARVRIHCTSALLRMLSTSPKTCPYILSRSDGRPWFTVGNDKALDKAWRAHMEAAGFYPKPFAKLTTDEKRANLHFNDLRGTAITLLAESGATVPQIVSITGHTLQSATRILERYLSITPALSKAAMTAFENASATGFANRLQTGTQ
jgi:integrase